MLNPIMTGSTLSKRVISPQIEKYKMAAIEINAILFLVVPLLFLIKMSILVANCKFWRPMGIILSHATFKMAAILKKKIGTTKKLYEVFIVLTWVWLSFKSKFCHSVTT